MKIIDIGICVNNIDPKGMGRIRCIRYNDYIGEKEKSLTYEEWDDQDPFIASPFLPTNINLIPEKGQAVKIINYNTEKETVNQEYIAGPFSTMFDFNGQTFSQQIENTTYGVSVKHKQDIRKSSGQFINPKAENAFAKETDYGVYGKFGSDIIFTENGLQLRGGKLLSKDAASSKNKEVMLDHPLMSKKSSKVILKKFPKKMTLDKKEQEKTTTLSSDLKAIIEYSVDSLSNPSVVNFYVYKITNSIGQTYKTNNFTEHTPLVTSTLKLINTDNTTVTPTFTLSVTSIDDVYKGIRNSLYDIHENSLKEINSLYSDEDLHPFFFRPSNDFFNLVPLNDTEKNNKTTILNNINLRRVGPSSGLIWSKSNANPPVVVKKVIEDFLKIHSDSPEQTFSTVVSDVIYFLSTDSNEVDKKISFDDLDKYDYTQEDYMLKIDPNTYSSVRGENLIKVLYAIVDVIYTHKHNINKPINGQTDYKEGERLTELIKSLENDILNKSIRIN